MFLYVWVGRSSGQLRCPIVLSLICPKISWWELIPWWMVPAPTTQSTWAKTTRNWFRSLPALVSPNKFVIKKEVRCRKCINVLNGVIDTFLGVAGTEAKDFACVFYNMERVQCTWTRSPRTPADSQQSLFFWYVTNVKKAVSDDCQSVFIVPDKTL